MRESRGVRRTAGREIEFGEEELETSAPEGALMASDWRHRRSDALIRNGFSANSPHPTPPQPNPLQTNPQKLLRTRKGITTTASSATGLPSLSAGRNFHRDKALAA